MGIFDDCFFQALTSPRYSWTLQGELVDTSKFDVVPKESYKKELVVQKEKEIEQGETRLKELKEGLKKLKE